MAQPRGAPYMQVTWLSKVLAGDAFCEWALWFRTNNRYEKQPSDFDFDSWAEQHSAMVRTRAQQLRDAGYTVFVEGQNSFTLPGRSATLGGQPDILAVNTTDALIVDCKTGTPRNAHRLQVLVYMYVAPFVRPVCRGKQLCGEVLYTNRTLRVPIEDLTEETQTLIRTMIQRAAGAAPLLKVPSFAECRFCDITAADCPERVAQEQAAPEPDHGLF